MRVYRFCKVWPGFPVLPARQPRHHRRSDSGPEADRHQQETHDMTHDHDTVVVERNGGSGVGAILGVIVVLALIIGFWFFAFGPGKGTFGGSTSSGTDINVNVELPSVAPAAS
jgi:hypothetical protein